MGEADPRVFFAAERTLLAWVRTGLTVMALGFVVARFGLFLRLLQLQSQASPERNGLGVSAILGVLFVLVGALAVLLATVQHQRFISTLPPSDRPALYRREFAVLFAAAIGVLGLLLAVYLVVSPA